MRHGVIRYERDESDQLWAVHSTMRVAVESMPSSYAIGLMKLLDNVEERLKNMQAEAMKWHEALESERGRP